MLKTRYPFPGTKKDQLVPLITLPKTTVVNVRVEHIRPTHQNLREWMNDPDHVYIGRRGVVVIDGQRWPPKPSIWANPFKTRDIPVEEAISLYRVHLDKLLKQKGMVNELLQLQGKVLGCWCKPGPCHGDVLVETIEELASAMRPEN